MAYLVNVIAVVVIMGRVASGQIKVEKDDNIEPFALLCRIYNVAKNPPITDVDMDEGYKIVKEIDALNRSLLEEERHDEKEDAGNNSEASVKPIVTREAALAQASLNQIIQRAHTILEEIKKVNAAENIEKAKVEFHKVIFGENGNESELDQGALNGIGDRAKACGDTGLTDKGNSAGNNLVVDFFCLCVQRPDGEGANQVCGFYVGSNNKNGHLGWSKAGPSGSSTMWASIKGGCGKHMQQHPKSTEEARYILDQFLKHLKTGGVYRQIKCETSQPMCKNAIVKDSNRKEGMLGTGVTVDDTAKVTCDGKKGDDKKLEAGGVCVYYGGEPEWKNIPWVITFETALATADYANNKTATIQRNIKKLQMLLHRAEEIYETAKVVTEIPSPVVLAAYKNATGNLTAHNTTRTRSYTCRSHMYFTILWVLFLQ